MRLNRVYAAQPLATGAEVQPSLPSTSWVQVRISAGDMTCGSSPRTVGENATRHRIEKATPRNVW